MEIQAEQTHKEGKIEKIEGLSDYLIIIRVIISFSTKTVQNYIQRWTSDIDISII